MFHCATVRKCQTRNSRNIQAGQIATAAITDSSFPMLPGRPMSAFSLPRAKEEERGSRRHVLHTARGRCSPFHLRLISPPLSQSDDNPALLRAILSDRKTDSETETGPTRRLTTPLRRLFKLDYIKGKKLFALAAANVREAL